jgi:hypothetical protein
MEGKIDVWADNPLKEGRPFKGWNNGMLEGVLSDGIGGAIHGAGDQYLKGNHNWLEIFQEGYLGFAQGASNKVIGNGFDKIANFSPQSAEDELKGGPNLAKYALMVPKQVGSVLGSQLMYNRLKQLSDKGLRLDHDFGSNTNFENETSSWIRDYWKLLKDL